MNSAVQYRQLAGVKPFRLIRILPGRPDDVPAVGLVYDHLDNAKGTYEATSYRWGDPTDTKEISCDGVVFHATRNAFEFLQRLQLETAPRLVWMDAICINQQDTQERSQQVSQMVDIYQYAKGVVAWLGAEDDDSDLAMQYVSTLDESKYEQELLDIQTPRNHKIVTKSFLFDDLHHTLDNKRLALALIKLVEREWSRRVWVQQEAIACAETTILCGDRQIQFGQLFSLSWLLQARTAFDWPDWLEYSDATLGGQQKIIKHMFENRQYKFSTIALTHWSENMDSRMHSDFQGAMINCWGCLATDPRDKIYALLGLWTHVEANNPPPLIDYDLPWQTVYTKAAQWIYQSPRLGMFLRAGRSKHTSTDLPSWVPDFRYPYELNVPPMPTQWRAGGTEIVSKQPLFKFGTISKPQNVPYPRPTHENKNGKKKVIPMSYIEMPVLMLDRIVFTGSVGERFSDAMTTNAESSEELACIEDECHQFVQQHLPPTYINDEPTIDAYASTLIANTAHDGSAADLEYCGEYTNWKAWVAQGCTGKVQPYHLAILHASTFRKTQFCVSAHGYMCHADAPVVSGDYVAILEGIVMPVVLRRTSVTAKDRPGPLFEFMGNCYVHGVMYGEGRDLMDEHKCKVRDGVLPGDEDGCCSSVDGTNVGYARILHTLGKRRLTII